VKKYPLDFEQSVKPLSEYDILPSGKQVFCLEDALKTAKEIRYPVIVYKNGYAIVDTRLIRDPDFVAPPRRRISDWKRKSMDAVFNAESVAVVGVSGQRESSDSRLPTEPCVRVRTRLIMSLLSIDQDQTNVSSCRSILFPGPIHR